jgi:predicted DNA-binding protein (MmcQ/YjbR family)
MMTGDFYRSVYPGTVTRGYHCPPVQQPYFNTITLEGTVPDDILIEMIEHSYKVVVGKLPKKAQKELENAGQ